MQHWSRSIKNRAIRQSRTASLFFLFTLLALTSCQQKPTKVYETHSVSIQPFLVASKKPVVIGDETVVIDTRTAFNYTMARIPGSVRLDWRDFVEKKTEFKGQLKSDLYAEARRLARMGIQPEDHVVIVGEGVTAPVEMGRLAWTLLYMGFINIQMATLDYFDNPPMTHVQTEPPRKNAPIWKPEFRESIQADRDEVLATVLGKLPVGSYKVIDVRSEQEYFAKQRAAYVYPEINAIHIEWKEFFDQHGRLKLDMTNRLRSVGIGLNDRVIVISNEGVRSAAVTTALVGLGFTKAANYTGGYRELIRGRSRGFR